MSVKAIVFDLDDTLYLERDYVRSGLKAVDLHLQRAGLARGLFDAAWPQWCAGRHRQLFDVVLPQLGCRPDPELIATLVDVYRTHTPRIALCEDARACLDRWRHTPMSIITDGFAAAQLGKLEALGLRQPPIAFSIVTALLGADMGKPHPRAFLESAARHGAAGPAIVYIADNPAKDFVAPRALGWRTIQVNRRGAVHSRLPPGPDHAAEVEISSLDEIDRVLHAPALT